MFIDDSNIWIEAKRIESARKKLKSKEDPRVRLDIGNLMDLLGGDRPINDGYIFGSKPPSSDSFWKKYSKVAKCEVVTHERSRFTHREKQIDTALCCEMVSFAVNNKEDTRTVMVVVTGDLDVLPALLKILKESRLFIELWSWKCSLSYELATFASQEVRIKLQYLDSYTEKFIYTSLKFDISTSGMDGRARTHGVVLSFYSNWLDNWKSDLEEISLWPFQYYLFPDDPNQVLILFSDGKRLGNLFNIDNFLQKVRLEGGVSKAQKYSEFKAITVSTEDWDTEADN